MTDRVWPQVNTPYQTKDVAGLSMSSTKVAPTAADIFGTLAVSGPVVAGTKIEVISQAGSEEDLFAAFAGGKMEPTTGAATPPSAAGASYCGGVVQVRKMPIKLTQKLGQLQPFTAVFPKECTGELPSFGPT